MSKTDKVRSVEKIAKTGVATLGVCAGKHCAKAGTKRIACALRDALEELGMANSVRVELTKCQDYCDDAPVVTMIPGPFPYINLTPETARLLVVEHLCNARPVVSLLHKRVRKQIKEGVL